MCGWVLGGDGSSGGINGDRGALGRTHTYVYRPNQNQKPTSQTKTKPKPTPPPSKNTKTKQDPAHVPEDVGVGGDNDPLDVCEIGLRQIPTGAVSKGV